MDYWPLVAAALNYGKSLFPSGAKYRTWIAEGWQSNSRKAFLAHAEREVLALDVVASIVSGILFEERKWLARLFGQVSTQAA